MSTFHSIYFHVVFSTKHRKRFISDRWIGRLHEYLGGTLKGLGAVPCQIGGVDDHVHLLVGCNTTHRPCDLVRDLKKSATKWVHEEIAFAPFAWQDGYAIFSVSPNACRTVARYIERQYEHHRKRSFKEELIGMLNRAGVEYDPKYLE